MLQEKYHHLEIDKKGWRLNDIHQVDIKANQVENELKELNNTLSSYQVLPSVSVIPLEREKRRKRKKGEILISTYIGIGNGTRLNQDSRNRRAIGKVLHKL